jgi:hypothetical protein
MFSMARLLCRKLLTFFSEKTKSKVEKLKINPNTNTTQAFSEYGLKQTWLSALLD